MNNNRREEYLSIKDHGYRAMPVSTTGRASVQKPKGKIKNDNNIKKSTAKPSYDSYERGSAKCYLGTKYGVPLGSVHESVEREF